VPSAFIIFLFVLNAFKFQELWFSRGQIQNCLPGNEISDFAAISSKDDWEETRRAKNLFNARQYALIKVSFMRANNLRMAAVANAYVLQDVAQKVYHFGTTKTRQQPSNRRRKHS
jgi:hypothetical protein